MEAQYARVKKKPIVPLKLTEWYEADGWLKLLLGTSLCFSFYGSTLSSESAFDARVESLARELGDRGHRDAAVVGDDDGSSGGRQEPAAEIRRLGSLGLKELRKRAKAEGLAASDVEQAMDAPDPKETIIGLMMMQKLQAESP